MKKNNCIIQIDTHTSPNINKNISKIEMKNLDNNNIKVSSMNG